MREYTRKELGLAPWWKFWNMTSGAPGGFIAAVVFSAVFVMIVVFISRL